MGGESAISTDWYKDAVIYELHVRAFYDANGDGVGDFRGLIEKLPYLQDLGVDCLWLLPFFPSPLRDDGYDVADHTAVNPNYGTLDDFKRFLDEAHRRGMRVITEVVVNHTSDEHPWFQAARGDPSSPYRDFYVWSDDPTKYAGARIIFTDTEHSNWTYDALAGSHYWHRFFSHQPDLNFDNPAVHDAIIEIMRFWLDLGVDGFRLDAVPYLYEREGTNCENLPETHAFVKKVRAWMDEHYPGRMLLAEANQWPADVVDYFGRGDEFHMAYHFPIMPRLFMALRRESSRPIIEILEQTPPIPDGCQWAMFLRNHDELTLEMVTDDERDYMYNEYAEDPRMRINVGIRRRLAPLMMNNRRAVELLHAILLTLPGSPIIYYGDEIGMGDNIYLGDRNGVRTPMQWSADRNAGFSRAESARLYSPVIVDPPYGYHAVNVEAQERLATSLLHWMRRFIAVRRQYSCFGRGSFAVIESQDDRVLAYVREDEHAAILCVFNVSRFVRWTGLDLSGFRGRVPVELMGGSLFPQIGEDPYFLSLGPHTFYLFRLVTT